MKSVVYIYFLSCLCIFAGFDQSSAETKEAQTELSIGLSATVTTSLYKGYEKEWTPLPIVSFENDWVYIRGVATGVKIVNLEFLELSAFAAYDSTAFNAKKSRNSHLRRLDNRYSSVPAGMEVRLLTPYGMLLANGARDVLGNSRGFTGEFGYKFSLEAGPVEFIPATGMYLATAGYNKYYYGVSRKESRKSGLESYSPGSNFSPYINLTVDWEINKHWDIYCHGEIVFPGGAVSNSPMVGKSNAKGMHSGVIYSF